MVKKVLSLLLALLMVMGTVSAVAEEKKDTWLFDEMVTIEIMRPETANQPFPEQNPVLDWIRENKGVDIKLTLVMSDYADKCKTLIATGDMPDVMLLDRAGVAVPMQSEGMFLCVSDYFDQMPNYMKAQEKNVNLYRFGTAEGKSNYLLTATAFRYTGATAPAVRMDMLAKSGMEAPKNYEELYALLKNLKEQNPDGFPVSSRWSYSRVFETMAYPMGSGWDMYWEPRENKWVFGPATDDFKDVVAYFAQMYADGILDPDFSVNESGNFKERFSAGVSSYHFENSSFLMGYNPILKDSVGPDAYFDLTPVPANKYGESRQVGWGLYNYDDAIVVNGDAENPEQIIKILDWFYSEEALELTNWGIEGVSFRYNEEGKRELIPEYVAPYMESADPWRAFMGSMGLGQLGLAMYVDESTQEMFLDEVSAAQYQYIANDPAYTEPVMAPSFTDDELAELAEIKANIEPIMAPALEGMITGSVSIDTYADMVAQIKDAGYERMEEIYNAAEARMAGN